jgi:DNA-binding XRE family transcriptional regulator
LHCNLPRFQKTDGGFRFNPLRGGMLFQSDFINMWLIVRCNKSHKILPCFIIMDDLAILIGKRIKTLRNDLSLSQETLANIAEIDRTYMTDIENGKRNVSVNILYKIATVLNVTLEEFFKKKAFQDEK